MKKTLVSLLVIFTLAGTTTFVSCKKDKEASNQEQIVGTWTMDKILFEMNVGGVSQKDTTEFEAGESVEFKANGTVTSSDGDATSTWEITGTKLKVVDPEDGPQEFEIKRLNGTELQLYSKETDGDDFMESTLYLKR